ncbi:hypothetical protein M231_04721 [Tremella mesenterica]|uniref:Rho-GAP domain-containing protein n=1 Tax=Tremella mesenterica TaxID=5217 RepID=A0A4Q1BJX2_TREME|nr:hypothetical protein M231_04721 [Tremella mesenterica]
MAPVTLPPSFYNSFWSPDYRSGLQVLFHNLEQGCKEDRDLTEFIESQAEGNHALASTLLSLPSTSSSTSESSSSLQHSLLQLRAASHARGEAHRSLAQELDQKVLGGFRQWRVRHEDRIKMAKEDMLAKNGVVGIWEKDVQRLISLKQAYITKTRVADDSEDDAKFAPPTNNADIYTSSPEPRHALLRRSGTVADRISEKLRAASISSHGARVSIDGKTLPAPPTPLRVATPVNGNDSPSSPAREDAFIPPTEPGGKPFIGGPPLPPKDGNAQLDKLPPEPMLLSGLSLTPQGLKDLLQRLDTYLLTHPAPYSDAARSTILGTYEKTFSGEEVVEWLRENVEGFGGDWERCVEAAGELYRMGHLSRIGVGRGFEVQYDTFYILKLNPHDSPLVNFTSPLSPTTAKVPALLKAYLPNGLNSDEPAHVRARRDAIKAEEAYREGVRSAEEKRLEMEERVERGLRAWEKWERERLSVVASVLRQYQAALAKLPPRLEQMTKPTSLSVEAFNPDADLKALIEGNRTGSFRPRPHIYESIESDIPEVNFGIDLRRWAGELGWKSMLNAPVRPKGSIPEVLTALLTALEMMYADLPDEERRRAWIYEVPLNETHMLRNVLNTPSMSLEAMVEMIKKYNVPVAAGVIKLYMLELNPPVMTWEGWEDARAVYPAVGADQERDMTSALTSVLSRLPSICLYVLEALVKHLHDLVHSTKTDETDEVYITKLALSVGRTILRPQYETEMTIQDRTSSLFLADLIAHYPDLLPPLVEKRKEGSGRPMPVKKRTALVDQRISRSRLSGDMKPEEILEAQYASHKRAISPLPEVRGSDVTPFNLPELPPLPASLASVEEPEILHLEKTVEVTNGTSGEESKGENESVQVIPPTPAQQIEETVPVPEQPEHEAVDSPTAAYLQSMEVGHEEENPVVRNVSGASVKRATSGEVSRLRGPRGARGPRPAPGRISHAHEDSRESARSPSPTHDHPPAGAGHVPRRSGAIRHGTGKGSVSQAIAAFEKRDP